LRGLIYKAIAKSFTES